MIHSDPAVQWLLSCDHPAVRYLTLTELLERSEEETEVREARSSILQDSWVTALFSGQEPDGGFGVHPYQKWTGAHWRLVSLVELGIPAGEPRARAAANQVLAWLNGRSHRERIQRIDGRTRRCASQEGNALAVCSRLGLAADPRVQFLAESLIEWQWPDGGWNCDKNPDAQHSSFYESLAPFWGLIEYYHATGDQACWEAAQRTEQFFLSHHLFRSDRTGKIINDEWLNLHYPLYWHYDILQALLILSRMGPLTDPSLGEALDILAEKRLPDGRWKPGGYYWRPPGKSRSNVEVVDWGRGEPNLMITLNALRVLKAAGRL
jgi:hypothetical protein